MTQPPYFKMIDLARRYHISESTVRNWIKLTQDGKLDLTLCRANGRSYVANLARNMPLIEQLVEENKKYRNSRAVRTVQPNPAFYRLFTQAQIYDIVRSIEMYHEIPRQYNYFDGGATEWDKYAQNQLRDDSPNLLNQTIELLSESHSYLDRRLGKFKRVNIVDVGVGNASPVRELLQHFLDRGVLGRYVAIDISHQMLTIAEHNVKRWFDGKVAFEGYEMDVNREHFANILAEDYLKSDSPGTANLLLFLGGTPYNFRYPEDAFRTIRDSMNINDLLIYSDKLETEDMQPEWFDHDIKASKSALAPRHRLVFDMLNIDETFYDVEVGFDARTRQRYTRARLKVALTLKFTFEEGERILEFNKGDAILLWRSWQLTAQNVTRQFDETGFNMLHSSQTDDGQYILTVAKPKCD